MTSVTKDSPYAQLAPPNLTQKGEKRNVFPFYKCIDEVYAPCLDWESHICFVTAKGDLIRLKKIKQTKKRYDSDSSSTPGESDSDDSSPPILNRKSTVGTKKKKREVDEENFVQLGFSTKCLCANTKSDFWVFHPITRAIVKVSNTKEIHPYLTEYENNFFNHINDIKFDTLNNTLYFVDSGNMYEENKSNIYFISEDTKTLLPLSLNNSFYISSFCLFQRNNQTIVYACATKENKIVRYIKKGNAFIKHVFRRFTGSFSPIYIATDNTNLLILMKDLSGCYMEGKIIEMQLNGQVINTHFMKGNNFNGICYDPVWKKYFFIEKNIIYSY